ncbi:hypothetical protein CRUP_003249 [Coryphaenoides rupestris]|nr:hypothetical protein CRUP_003249 [Coryphaenoides rupestris]
MANKRLAVAAVKNQATGHYILNGKGEQAGSRNFIDLGVEWEYLVEADVEALHTDGPLHDPEKPAALSPFQRGPPLVFLCSVFA